MATNPKKLKRFLGVNDWLGRTLPPSEEGRFVADAVNVDLGPAKNFFGRPGYTKVATFEQGHSLWATRDGRAFAVSGGQVHALVLPGGQATPLAIFVPQGGVASYVQLPGGDVAVSNGQAIYRVSPDNSVSPMAYPAPQPQPTAVVTPGNTTWLYCFAYVDEHGLVGLATSQLRAVGASLEFDVPAPPSGLRTQIYVSHPDGEVMQLLAQSLAGRVSVGTERIGGTCPTLHTQPLMPGHQLCLHAGRLYTVRGPVIYYSEPWQFGVMQPLNYLPLPASVTVLAHIPAGCFVVADKTYWLAGTDPQQAQLSVLSEHTALPRSLSYLHDGRPVWVSSSGTVLGGLDGGVIELTEPVVRGQDTQAAVGATLPIVRSGSERIISNHHRAGFGRAGVTMTAE